MYPTDLDAIYWEVIDLRYIISDINNMDSQPVQIPPSFKTLNATDTKTSNGPIQNYHREHPSRKRPETAKDSKFKINPHSVNGNSESLNN